MDTLNKVFLTDIQEMLFAKANFLETMTNYSPFAIGTEINIPSVDVDESGLMVKNPSGTAGDATRSDNNTKFTINYHAMKQVPFQYDTNMLSLYDYRSTTVNFVNSKFEEVVATQVCAEIAAGLSQSKVIETSGATVSYGNGKSRKKLTLADIRDIAQLMDQENVGEDRTLLLNSEFFYDILNEDLIANRNYIADTDATKKGIITEVYGFNVIKRNKVLVYEDDTALDYYSQVGATNSNGIGALAYSKESVCYAQTAPGVKIFTEIETPARYGGSAINGGVLVGASKTRYDQKGVFVLRSAYA